MDRRFVSGGYFLVRAAAREPWVSASMQECILSASRCICQIGPSLSWVWKAKPPPVGVVDERWSEPEEEAQHFGVPRTRMAELSDWLNEAFERDEIGFPDALESPAVARRFLEVFDITLAGLSLIGIATTPLHASQFASEVEIPEGHGEVGPRHYAAAALAPAAGGITLGYEVLGFDVGLFHSWICNGLERDAADDLGIRPNQHGFIATFEEAERVARWANDDEGTEPVDWRPWAISRYALRA